MSPYEKRMFKLVRQVRRSAQEGVLVTEKDEMLRQEMLRTCDRLELKMANAVEGKVELLTV